MKNAGGNLENIFHYNNNDEPTNTGSAGERVEDGTYVDYKQGSSEGSQPVYTEITASLDNICIALMATTWPDGSQFGWTGDWAIICELPLYYSGIIMPNRKSPACMWVDGRPNESHQAPYAIKLKWHDFFSEDGNLPSGSEAKEMCSRSFRAFTADLNEITLPANRA
ncbi:hypothetical protein BCR34DRAFT_608488 [Clohesyomyces aquaticus]|uniref:Uncharacterized protein n=1 Tax=Clohesyomyces aquaticus TaxID=1231657 RepID=A0A1Y1Y7F7_9PLEO|nr:hypothetical protein BCR34DRAFT_608488 [Clohesyomyces aquaticus]